jgi:hypothetical protein
MWTHSGHQRLSLNPIVVATIALITVLHIQPLLGNFTPLHLEQEVRQAAVGQVERVSHQLLVILSLPPMEIHPKLQPGVHMKLHRRVHILVLPPSTRLLIGGGVGWLVDLLG